MLRRGKLRTFKNPLILVPVHLDIDTEERPAAGLAGREGLAEGELKIDQPISFPPPPSYDATHQQDSRALPRFVTVAFNSALSPISATTTSRNLSDSYDCKW